MPIINSLSPMLKRPFNGHWHTLRPYFLREVKDVQLERERIDTPDGDFLVLDWSRQGSDRLVILSHGLEGSSQRSYILGMIRQFQALGFDALAWNYRSCSGELNRLPRFYHSGDTPDLNLVIEHARRSKHYRQIVLVGFSMGGNKTLKWLAEKGSLAGSDITAAIAISAPIELSSSSRQLARPENVLYMTNFLYTMKKKLLQKRLQHPLSEILWKDALLARHFHAWDQAVTAPLHGFKSAEDYYRRASAIHDLEAITVPVLILNALNDPFLSPACFPEKLARQSELIHLEVPRGGGHVGFETSEGAFWSEERAAAFYRQINGT